MHNAIVVAALCGESVLLRSSTDVDTLARIRGSIEISDCIDMTVADVTSAQQPIILAELLWRAVASAVAPAAGPIAVYLRGVEALGSEGGTFLSEVLRHRLLPIPSELRRRLSSSRVPHGAWHDGLATLPADVFIVGTSSGGQLSTSLSESFFIRSVGTCTEAAPRAARLSAAACRAVRARVAVVSMPLPAVAALENGLVARRRAATAGAIQHAFLEGSLPVPRSGSCFQPLGYREGSGLRLISTGATEAGGDGGPQGSDTTLARLQAECAALQAEMLCPADPSFPQSSATSSCAPTVAAAADSAPRVAQAARALAALDGRECASAADVERALVLVLGGPP